MKNIKSFKDWSMNEEFFGFGEDNELEVDPMTKSKFLPTMTFEDLSKKFGVTPEYISEFEIYLTNNIEMGNIRSSKISEEDYQFHLTENFPETHEDDDSGRHHQSDI